MKKTLQMHYECSVITIDSQVRLILVKHVVILMITLFLIYLITCFVYLTITKNNNDPTDQCKMYFTNMFLF